MIRRIVHLAALLALAATFPACTHRQRDDDEAESVKSVVAVKTAPIVRADMETVVIATGLTEAVAKEKILSPIAGTLISLKVLEGTAVRRGDVVAVIQPRETRAAISGAEALLRSATTPQEQTEARKALALAIQTENNLEIRASRDGVVASRSAMEGEQVAENAELLTLLDLSTLVFVADVPLADLPAIRRGERATVSFPSLPEDTFASVVEAVNPRSDPQSQSVRVRLSFQGSSGKWLHLLLTEMSGRARIVTGIHPHVLVVPRRALIRNDENDTYTVVTAGPDSLAHIVPVEPIARTDSTAEVRGTGLAPGMRVVVEGNYALADSTRIEPTPSQ
ncbi:MAG TPA: efflux RND transporter periplasmic adaptor subunit [Bacteroidota bacterium]|nr:efflux RND transporter periplasmic adaptor subunit [Bacteroidota bacterium]